MQLPQEDQGQWVLTDNLNYNTNNFDSLFDYDKNEIFQFIENSSSYYNSKKEALDALFSSNNFNDNYQVRLLINFKNKNIMKVIIYYNDELSTKPTHYSKAYNYIEMQYRDNQYSLKKSIESNQKANNNLNALIQELNVANPNINKAIEFIKDLIKNNNISQIEDFLSHIEVYLVPHGIPGINKFHDEKLSNIKLIISHQAFPKEELKKYMSEKLCSYIFSNNAAHLKPELKNFAPQSSIKKEQWVLIDNQNISTQEAIKNSTRYNTKEEALANLLPNLSLPNNKEKHDYQLIKLKDGEIEPKSRVMINRGNNFEENKNSSYEEDLNNWIFNTAYFNTHGVLSFRTNKENIKKDYIAMGKEHFKILSEAKNCANMKIRIINLKKIADDGNIEAKIHLLRYYLQNRSEGSLSQNDALSLSKDIFASKKDYLKSSVANEISNLKDNDKKLVNDLIYNKEFPFGEFYNRLTQENKKKVDDIKDNIKIENPISKPAAKPVAINSNGPWVLAKLDAVEGEIKNDETAIKVKIGGSTTKFASKKDAIEYLKQNQSDNPDAYVLVKCNGNNFDKILLAYKGRFDLSNTGDFKLENVAGQNIAKADIENLLRAYAQKSNVETWQINKVEDLTKVNISYKLPIENGEELRNFGNNTILNFNMEDAVSSEFIHKSPALYVLKANDGKFILSTHFGHYAQASKDLNSKESPEHHTQQLPIVAIVSGNYITALYDAIKAGEISKNKGLNADLTETIIPNKQPSSELHKQVRLFKPSAAAPQKQPLPEIQRFTEKSPPAQKSAIDNKTYKELHSELTILGDELFVLADEQRKVEEKLPSSIVSSSLSLWAGTNFSRKEFLNNIYNFAIDSNYTTNEESKKEILLGFLISEKIKIRSYVNDKLSFCEKDETKRKHIFEFKEKYNSIIDKYLPNQEDQKAALKAYEYYIANDIVKKTSVKSFFSLGK